MGILRTDKISGLETPTAVTGSVNFPGSDDYITAPANTPELLLGDADFTIEGWFYKTNTGQQDAFGLYQTANNRRSYLLTVGDSSTIFYYNYTGSSGTNVTASFTLPLNKWAHVAITRDGTTLKIYVDGELRGTTTGLTAGAYANTDDQFMIGSSDYSNANGSEWTGHISNLRIVKGYVLYDGDFTVPDHALEVVPGTVLLACNNPDSVTAVESALVGKGLTLTAVNDVAVTSVTPGLTRDFTSGTEFKGVTTFDTQGYFVPPSGTTEQRYNDVAKNAVSASSARGLFGGGNTPTKVNTIEYITISTTGNGTDFGDLTNTPAQAGGAASNTRGIVAGGYDGSARTNVINYLTVATTGNAQNFGDLIYGRSGLGALSNTTRAVFSGGYGSAVVNTMDYVTIASTGDAQDFGDLLGTNNEMTACASPTRGIFGSGDVPGDGTLTNTLQYITIATSGNTQDFGDLTIAADYSTGFSNSTRGIFYIGYTPNPASNIINFITISSTGNAVDFGDAYEKSGARSTTGASSSTRGVVAGGDSPAKSNSIEYVTIASLGNGQDFGALANFDTQSPFGLSDGHGGLG